MALKERAIGLELFYVLLKDFLVEQRCNFHLLISYRIFWHRGYKIPTYLHSLFLEKSVFAGHMEGPGQYADGQGFNPLILFISPLPPPPPPI
jgi:hypothetical protein